MDQPQVTRGGLKAATLVNESTHEVVPCTFNPFEYTLSKQNSWEKKPVKGKNVPKVTFKQGGSQILKLTLYFDTSDDGSDVRKYTDALWRMMMVDDNKKNDKSAKSEPPEVSFHWGRLYFTAVLTSMSQKFTLFKDDGTPIRCQVDVTLEQMIDKDDYREEGPAQGKGKEAARTVTATQSDRIDHIASKNSSGGSKDARSVAEKNNLDDPLKIPPGKKLKV
ncbi:MAG: hypothetical protein HXY40_09195 [Chloroflexi bacterium]|nr:hypothetical protein [Chloroflexota bacterium]